MRIALFIGGRSDYTGPAMRILPRTGARLYLSERWKVAKVENSINNNDRQQQLMHKLTDEANVLSYQLIKLKLCV